MDRSFSPVLPSFLFFFNPPGPSSSPPTHRLDQALCVTTHRAQGFPGRGFQSGKRGAEVFDRVLCDVPCSGDGTVRKTFNIWRSWYPGNAMGLHPLQVLTLLPACLPVLSALPPSTRARMYARTLTHTPMMPPRRSNESNYSCKSPAAGPS